MHNMSCLLPTLLTTIALVCACSTPGPTREEAPSKGEPAKTAEPAKADDLCQLVSDAWDDCKGQKVRLEGKTPRMEYQHPMAPPGEQQTYLELEDGAQIIVSTTSEEKCEGKMRVEGTLGRIELGGQRGTKASYANWVIQEATLTCL